MGICPSRRLNNRLFIQTSQVSDIRHETHTFSLRLTLTCTLSCRMVPMIDVAVHVRLTLLLLLTYS